MEPEAGSQELLVHGRLAFTQREQNSRLGPHNRLKVDSRKEIENNGEVMGWNLAAGQDGCQDKSIPVNGRAYKAINAWQNVFQGGDIAIGMAAALVTARGAASLLFWPSRQ
jgi:hypothetical protein